MVFKDFINKYGTHFSTNTYMGVKILATKLYSVNEKRDISDEDLKRCNTENAIKVVRFQVDPDTEKCKSKAVLYQKRAMFNTKRTIVSTHGTFIANKVPDDDFEASSWEKLVAYLMKKRKLVPRVLQRELIFIFRYFFYKI